MIELGRVQELMVVREKNFGVYLGQKKDDAAAVLLPKKQVPEGTKVGDKLKVFSYKDSEDRLIATTSMPKLELGGTAVLKVKDVSKIGAFLDMGLEKDLLLPFKEQVYPVRAGEECLVALYIDKSGRLAATMKVYSYLCSDAPYKKDEWIQYLIVRRSRLASLVERRPHRLQGRLPVHRRTPQGNHRDRQDGAGRGTGLQRGPQPVLRHAPLLLHPHLLLRRHAT